MSTLGLTTTDPSTSDAFLSSISPSLTPNPITSPLFKSYYTEGIKGYPRQLELYDVVKDIEIYCRQNHSHVIDFLPSPAFLPSYEDVVKEPMWIRLLIERVQKGVYNDTYEQFLKFVDDILLMFSNALLYSPTSPEILHSVQECRKFSLGKVNDFARSLMKSARRHVSPSSTPVAYGLVEKLNEFERIKSLKRSHTTLIVVPIQLLQHWENQILQHVDMKWVANVDNEVDDCHVVRFRKGSAGRNNTLLSNNNSRNFLFIDYDRSSNLPEPDVLSAFDIVITSVERMSNEWKKGNKLVTNYDITFPSPLLKINFLRVVVDEGHSMGKSGFNNSILFASQINSERRWIMSGTPTPNTSGTSNMTTTAKAASEVKTLLGLLQFIRHPLYLVENDGCNLFINQFLKGWRSSSYASFFSLKQLLSVVMIRHTKEHVANLPRPIFKTNYLRMSKAETLAYNTITTVARINIVTTTMEGAKTSGWIDSILNPGKYKEATEMFRNIRLACCGSRSVNPTLTSKNFNETVEYMQYRHNCKPATLQLVRNFMNRCVMGETTSCQICAFDFQLLCLLPCAHFICPDCLVKTPKVCGACDKPYDVDEFQELQPGFDTQWVSHLAAAEEELKRRKTIAENLRISEAIVAVSNNAPPLPTPTPTTPNPGNPAPVQVAPLPAALPPPPLRKHKCVYNSQIGDGICTICFKMHSNCHMTSTTPCPICHMRSQPCPKEETKASYLCERLTRLQVKHKQGDANISPGGNAFNLFFANSAPPTRISGLPPLKVFIFSQFKTIRDVIADRILRQFGQRCIAEYWGVGKHSELMRFKQDPSCFAIIAGKEASHGLDLSFLTHIFLLDEIWDTSLKDQVVARAYRMGTVGSVIVEQLVAKQSIEQVMNEINNAKWKEDKEEEKGKVGSEKFNTVKLHGLIKKLRVIKGEAKADKKKRARVGEDEGGGSRKGNEDEEDPPARRVRFG